MNKEIIETIKNVKTVAELKDVANKNGYSLNDQEASDYFNLYHKEGQVNEDELDNVTGGSTCKGGKFYSDDAPYYLIVTVGNTCPGQVDNDVYAGVSGTCAKCNFKQRHGAITYCGMRFAHDDPYNDDIGTKRKAFPDGRYWDDVGAFESIK